VLAENAKYFHVDEFIRPEFYFNKWNKNRFSNDSITLITITKGVEYKGLELLLMISSLLSKITKYSFQIKIIGLKSDSQFFHNVKEGIKKLWPINVKMIELLGYLSTEDIIREMLNSDIYIHTSKIENSPNSICEAMALGLPIIATNVGGVPTLIEDNVNGILVQEDEPYSFCGAILELANDYTKAYALGRKANEKQLIRGDYKGITRSFQEIYFGMVNDI
jgi:glycosyltransferase involved in cell wall biosynthesis